MEPNTNLFTPQGLAELLATFAAGQTPFDSRHDHLYWALMEFEDQATATSAMADPEYHDAVGRWAEEGARLINSRPATRT